MDFALLGSFWESPNGKKVCFSNFLLLNIWIINCCILSNWLGLLICIQTVLILCYTSTMYQRQLKSQEEKRIKEDKATKNTFLKYMLWVFLLGDNIYIYIYKEPCTSIRHAWFLCLICKSPLLLSTPGTFNNIVE